MQLNLKLFISTLALLLSMGSAFGLQTPATGTQKTGKAVAERESTKYRRFFFPHGLPLRANDYTDRQERPSYKFYSDLQVPNTQLVVAVYSEKLETQEYSDKLYWIHLGVLQRIQNSFTVVEDLDISENSPIFTEGPGNFLSMNAKLSSFELRQGVPVVHLNLWSTLSGTGAASAGSDLFYLLPTGGKLQQVLELKQTSLYGRGGASGTQNKVSKIWAKDVDGDGVTDIVVQTIENREQEGKSSTATHEPALYKFQNDKYVQVGSVSKDVVTQKLETSEPLPKVKEIKDPGKAEEQQ